MIHRPLQGRVPGYRVQFLDMGSREILERVRAERNRPQADLWWGAAHTTFQTAAEENLLAPIPANLGRKCFQLHSRHSGPLVWHLSNSGSNRLQQRCGETRRSAKGLGRRSRSEVARQDIDTQSESVRLDARDFRRDDLAFL